MHDYQAIIFGYHANKEHHGMSLNDREKKNSILLQSENEEKCFIFQFATINAEVEYLFCSSTHIEISFCSC